MNYGFEITSQDVENVLASYQVENYNIDEIMCMIDDDAVSSAALDTEVASDDDTTMQNQTEAAYDEIAHQLFQAGYITREQVENFGNTAILG